MVWLSQAIISEENKKAITDKIQWIIRCERAKGKQKEQSSDNYCDSTSGPVARSLQRAREQTNGRNHAKKDSPGTDQTTAEVASKDESSPKAAGQSSSRALWKGPSFCNGFPFAVTVCKFIGLLMMRMRALFSSHWESVPEGKVILTGAFAPVLLIALLRNRRRLFSFLASMANPVRSALRDLWQQAFSVQLNPLAAAQPLPTARALVA